MNVVLVELWSKAERQHVAGAPPFRPVGLVKNMRTAYGVIALTYEWRTAFSHRRERQSRFKRRIGVSYGTRTLAIVVPSFGQAECSLTWIKTENDTCPHVSYD